MQIVAESGPFSLQKIELEWVKSFKDSIQYCTIKVKFEYAPKKKRSAPISSYAIRHHCTVKVTI